MSQSEEWPRDAYGVTPGGQKIAKIDRPGGDLPVAVAPIGELLRGDKRPVPDEPDAGPSSLPPLPPPPRRWGVVQEGGVARVVDRSPGKEHVPPAAAAAVAPHPVLVFMWAHWLAALLEAMQFIALMGAVAVPLPAPLLALSAAFSWANLWVPLAPHGVTEAEVAADQAAGTGESGFGPLLESLHIDAHGLLPSTAASFAVVLAATALGSLGVAAIVVLRRCCGKAPSERGWSIQRAFLGVLYRVCALAFVGTTAASVHRFAIGGGSDRMMALGIVLLAINMILVCAPAFVRRAAASFELPFPNDGMWDYFQGVYRNLKPGRGWFEVFASWHAVSLALVVAAITTPALATTQLAILLGILVAYALLLVLIRPYAGKMAQVVAVISTLLRIVHVGCLFAMTSDRPPEHRLPAAWAAVAAEILNLSLPFTFLGGCFIHFILHGPLRLPSGERAQSKWASGKVLPSASPEQEQCDPAKKPAALPLPAISRSHDGDLEEARGGAKGKEDDGHVPMQEIAPKDGLLGVPNGDSGRSSDLNDSFDESPSAPRFRKIRHRGPSSERADATPPHGAHAPSASSPAQPPSPKAPSPKAQPNQQPAQPLAPSPPRHPGSPKAAAAADIEHVPVVPVHGLGLEHPVDETQARFERSQSVDPEKARHDTPGASPSLAARPDFLGSDISASIPMAKPAALARTLSVPSSLKSPTVSNSPKGSSKVIAIPPLRLPNGGQGDKVLAVPKMSPQRAQPSPRNRTRNIKSANSSPRGTMGPSLSPRHAKSVLSPRGGLPGGVGDSMSDVCSENEESFASDRSHSSRQSSASPRFPRGIGLEGAETGSPVRGRAGLRLDLTKLSRGAEEAMDESTARRLSDVDRAERQKMMELAGHISEIYPYLYVGAQEIARDLSKLREEGITHVINTVGQVCENYHDPDIQYFTVALGDVALDDACCLFYDVIDYIRNARDSGGKVFVHCMQGMSRSVTLVLAWTMFENDWDYDTALNFVVSKREIAAPNTGFMVQLCEWYQRRHGSLDAPIMYRITPQCAAWDRERNLVAKEVRELEREVKAGVVLLDPRTCYVLQPAAPAAAIFTWRGSQAPAEMDAAVDRCIERLQNFEGAPEDVVRLAEGDTPQAFLQALATRRRREASPYSSAAPSPSASPRSPRVAVRVALRPEYRADYSGPARAAVPQLRLGGPRTVADDKGNKDDRDQEDDDQDEDEDEDDEDRSGDSRDDRSRSRSRSRDSDGSRSGGDRRRRNDDSRSDHSGSGERRRRGDTSGDQSSGGHRSDGSGQRDEDDDLPEGYPRPPSARRGETSRRRSPSGERSPSGDRYSRRRSRSGESDQESPRRERETKRPAVPRLGGIGNLGRPPLPPRRRQSPERVYGNVEQGDEDLPEGYPRPPADRRRGGSPERYGDNVDHQADQGDDDLPEGYPRPPPRRRRQEPETDTRPVPSFKPPSIPTLSLHGVGNLGVRDSEEDALRDSTRARPVEDEASRELGGQHGGDVLGLLPSPQGTPRRRGRGTSREASPDGATRGTRSSVGSARTSVTEDDGDSLPGTSRAGDASMTSLDTFGASTLGMANISIQGVTPRKSSR